MGEISICWGCLNRTSCSMFDDAMYNNTVKKIIVECRCMVKPNNKETYTDEMYIEHLHRINDIRRKKGYGKIEVSVLENKEYATSIRGKG
jgi:hypothetical protein